MKIYFLRIAVSLPLCCFLLAGVSVAQGSLLTPLHSFSVFPQGAQPRAALVQASDGNFYGTTSAGGTNGANGTIFRMSPSGTITTLYKFTGGTDGANPDCSLVQGPDGSLYGTCSSGGDAYGDGTAFKITTGGTFTLLHTFGTLTDQSGDLLDGTDPEGGMIQGKDGNFYGTCYADGTNYDGTIFQITPSGNFTVVYPFGTIQDGSGDPLDGANPNGTLVQGPDGNLYGTCSAGGANGYGPYDDLGGDGDVFKITTSGALNVLYSFGVSQDSNYNPLDGGQPNAGLVLGKDGNYYGTCSVGGANSLYGTVFQVSSNGAFSTLYSFTGGSDGATPGSGTLVQAANGTLYGTTENDGTYGVGTIFNITTNGNTFSTVHEFSSGADGANPQGGLNLGTGGSLFGTTTYGNTNNAGTVFNISSQGTYAKLTGFAGILDVANPSAGLIHGKDGKLYGAAANGGAAGNGAVFVVTANGAVTVLHSFGTVPDRATGELLDGTQPECVLVQGVDGSFYGTTAGGGTNGDGTVFKVTTNGTFTVLYAFGAVTNSMGVALDGSDPQGGLVQGQGGNFYGTTAYGGNNDDGTVFQINTNGTLTLLYAFGTVQDSFGDPLDGESPACTLVLGTDGNLYGTCPGGGASLDGDVFQFTTNGALNVLWSFDSGSDGANPRAGLIQAIDGNLYGTSTYGGDYTNYGTVFQVKTNGAFERIWSFTGNSDGGDPEGGLVQGADGVLYGTTSSGGSTNEFGTLFQISTNANFTLLWDFTGGNDGANPNDSLLPAGNGTFYGMTEYGGAGAAGTLFVINLGPAVQLLSIQSGTVTLSFNAVVGLTYQVQYTTNVAQPSWTNLGGQITATNQIMQVQDTAATGRQRFYRAVLLTDVLN